MASLSSSVPTICLNMIVKNESKIIRRLLESVVNFIDTYCICDTGSTDNTVEVIEQFFKEKNMTGKIGHEPFVNFEYNRTHALQMCIGMSDYILLMDADMVLENKGFDKSSLVADAYTLYQGHKETYYYGNLRIVRNTKQVVYKGVTHEYLHLFPNATRGSISKDVLFIIDINDGGCKSNKYERDIELLKKGLETDPKNSRYMFYLANSYFDLGQYEECIVHYKKNIEMRGWIQEVWYSYYRVGMAYKNMAVKIKRQVNNGQNGPEEKNKIDELHSKAIFYWLEAYELLPKRIENLFEIIHYYRVHNKHQLALAFYIIAKNILNDPSISREKDDYLFLNNDVYLYKLDYEFSIIGFYNGIKDMSKTMVNILNTCNDPSIVDSCYQNMKFYNNILKPTIVMDVSESLSCVVLPKQGLSETVSESTKKVFQSSNCCLIPWKDGYMMNMSYNDYTIDKNGKYNYHDNMCIYINKRVLLTKSMKKISESIYSYSLDEKQWKIGMEDIRLMPKLDGKSVLFTACGLHENGNTGMFFGTYYDEDKSLDQAQTHVQEKKAIENSQILNKKEIKCGFENNACEKNWAFIPLRFYKEDEDVSKNYYGFIYKFYPLEVGILNEETNKIEKIATKPMPLFFKNARGSTNGFSFGDELWFCVHFVHYESTSLRHYYHILMKTDKHMNLVSYSAPFKFEGEPIEFCLGLVVEEDRVIMSYSTWDRTSKIAVYDKKYIDSMCYYQ